MEVCDSSGEGHLLGIFLQIWSKASCTLGYLKTKLQSVIFFAYTFWLAKTNSDISPNAIFKAIAGAGIKAGRFNAFPSADEN